MDYLQFFYNMKWPDGFRCPKCCHPAAYVIQSRNMPLYQCRSCRHQTSLTAGTVMEGSRTPLAKWYTAIEAMSRPGGINAVQLMNLIQVTYKTAWSMLRKLRQAIHNEDATTPLSGEMEIGLAFYGRTYPHPFVRYATEVPVIVGIAFRGNRELGYMKMKPVNLNHMEGKVLLTSGERDFLSRHADAPPGTKIASYFRTHRLPEIRFMFRQAKRWINRTFHGIGRKYLEYYFDEYCFRWSLIYRGVPAMERLSELAMRSVHGGTPRRHQLKAA